MRVANRRNEIVDLAIENPIDRFAHHLVLCAYFAADRKQRATKHIAAFPLHLSEPVVHKLKIAFQSLERRNRWRKNPVHVDLALVPVGFLGRDREFGLYLEEVLDTSRLRAR